MRPPRMLAGQLLLLAWLALPPAAGATPGDSSYALPDLRASTAAPWNPTRPVPAARGWETALRLPGRIVSLPLVAMGGLMERSLVYLESAKVGDRLRGKIESTREFGVVLMPVSLGDGAGFAGEAGWAPRPLGYRLRADVSGTTNHYNRERVTGALGPVCAAYASEWRSREHYFGHGMGAPLDGESAYAERTESARIILSWGWQGFDSTQASRTEPLMFRDRVRLRGPLHRTWVSAWAGPRKSTVSRGRDPDSPSFEVVHPVVAAGSLGRSVEHFTYGVGVAHDGRGGLPRWSHGWRASVEAERYDRSIRALALDDAHSGARSFTRLTYHAETAASFGRDPRTLRLSLTAVDQRPDAAGGTLLIGDLESLGGGAGLSGFEPGRFHELDLVLAKLTYLFPLVTNLEFELHAESGGVYPGMSQARLPAMRNSLGAALRVRTDLAMLGALGCDWSPEQPRFWLKLGGVE